MTGPSPSGASPSDSEEWSVPDSDGWPPISDVVGDRHSSRSASVPLFHEESLLPIEPTKTESNQQEESRPNTHKDEKKEKEDKEEIGGKKYNRANDYDPDMAMSTSRYRRLLEEDGAHQNLLRDMSHSLQDLTHRQLPAFVKEHARGNDIFKKGLEALAESVKETASEKTTMAMLPGDQIITGILTIMAAIAVTLPIANYLSEVTCLIPTRRDYSAFPDGTTSFISSFCSDKHTRGGEVAFYLFLQSTLLGLPSIAFYNLWGAALSRHVAQIVATRTAMVDDVNQQILDDARPALKREFEEAKNAHDNKLKVKPYDPDSSHVRPKSTLGLVNRKAEITRRFNAQLKKEALEALDAELQLQDSHDVFNHVVAVVGLGGSTGGKMWARPFFISIIAEALIAAGSIAFWRAFWWGMMSNFDLSVDSDSGHSRGSFTCKLDDKVKKIMTLIVMDQDPNHAADAIPTEEIACVAPANFFASILVWVNLALVILIFLISTMRLCIISCSSSKAGRICESDDMGLLYYACEFTAPDLMRTRSFAAYKWQVRAAQERMEDRVRSLKATPSPDSLEYCLKSLFLLKKFWELMEARFGRPDENPALHPDYYRSLGRFDDATEKARLIHLESLTLRLSQCFKDPPRFTGPDPPQRPSPINLPDLIEHLCHAEKVHLPLDLLAWLSKCTESERDQVEQQLDAASRQYVASNFSLAQDPIQLDKFKEEEWDLIQGCWELAFPLIHEERRRSR